MLASFTVNDRLETAVGGSLMIYLSPPEYFTEYAKKMVELGMRGVAGANR